VNVDGGAETGTTVGGAGGDVAEMVIVLEIHRIFDVPSSGNKALENLEKGGALLHRNDAEMVFLVYPHEEGLVLVVVNTTVLGPVAVQVASFEEAVSLLEQEMVFNELLLCFLVHLVKAVVSSFKLTFERGECLLNLTFEFGATIVAKSGA
jgi:hypothetical protein